MPLTSALFLLTAVGLTGTAQEGVQRVVPPNPNPGGFIADGGPVLSPDDRARLNGLIASIQAEGSGDVGVAIVRDLQDYPPYEVGLAIYRTWKIGTVDTLGSARRDLGALLLIVPKELAPSGRGECWITTGTGAEGILTDAMAATICREEVIPHLKDRDYAAAIEAGVTAIAARFRKQIEGSPAAGGRRPGRGSPLMPVGGGLLTLLGAGAGVVAMKRRKRRKPRPCPRGHGLMQVVDEAGDDAFLSEGQRTEEKLRSVDYDVWRCPVCEERLVIPYKRWFSGYGQCPDCHFWTLKSTTRTITPATTTSTGLAETTKRCKQCGYSRTTRKVLPRITSSSSSSSSGGGGGGGGSSFGGSGSSSGGGGGSSY